MRAYRLVNKDRKILGHRVTKVRPEYSDVVATPVPETDHSFRFNLVRDADTRTESADVVLDVAVESVLAEATHANDAFGEIGETAVTLGIHRFREIILPPDAVG